MQHQPKEGINELDLIAQEFCETFRSRRYKGEIKTNRGEMEEDQSNWNSKKTEKRKRKRSKDIMTEFARTDERSTGIRSTIYTNWDK